MDLDSLNAFVKVVDEGSFSLAAEQLNITQPAISKRIQNLEKNLNVSLFERLQREVSLTQAGETLLPHALAILQSVDNAKLAIRELDTSVTGSLRIVASHHIGLHRLPKILKEFSQRYADVDLQLNFLDSESAYPLLNHNNADLAFVTIPKEVREGFNCHLEWHDPMSFICSNAHPLAQQGQITPDELSQHNAILPSTSTLTYRVVAELFREHRLDLKANIPTNYLETMKMMASAGMGWSVLPNTMVDESLHVLPIFRGRISRKLGAISYQKKQLSKAARAFIEIAESVWGNQLS